MIRQIAFWLVFAAMLLVGIGRIVQAIHADVESRKTVHIWYEI